MPFLGSVRSLLWLPRTLRSGSFKTYSMVSLLRVKGELEKLTNYRSQDILKSVATKKESVWCRSASWGM